MLSFKEAGTKARELLKHLKDDYLSYDKQSWPEQMALKRIQFFYVLNKSSAH